MLCFIKIIFFFYNYSLYSGWHIHSVMDMVRISAWSLYYDMAIACLVMLPFLVGCYFAGKINFIARILVWSSLLLIMVTVLLNLVDVFYFSFHRQRADSDLLYVLRNPFQYSNAKLWEIIVFVIICQYFLGGYIYKFLTKLCSGSQRYHFTLLFSLLLVGSLFLNKKKWMLPTAPLVSVKPEQLPLTQNSLHSFLYSLYRSEENTLPAHHFMDSKTMLQNFSIYKLNETVKPPPGKNIMLFIMESIPYEFFDSSNPQKPALPFFDSLLQHSVFYNNAFSYSYNSNKGITAILAGIPTIIDIPLYHSGYINLQKTAIGNVLAKENYSSAFFIGDNYDDFGFAKCCNWLGIQHYHSMENVPGYRGLPKHTMGLQDEYVLSYASEQINKLKPPFFSCFYNISTHYPNDLTEEWRKKTEKLSISPAAKSMLYYDECLKKFFYQNSKQEWFKNTIFIFCSDHWASPARSDPSDKVNSFRIPIILYDPSVNTKRVMNNIVSQLDIMNTLLAYAGNKNSFISYGRSLLESDTSRVVFTKLNNSIYQAINHQYVLGMDADNGNALYCYQYKNDPAYTHNLITAQNNDVQTLEVQLKAFLQTAAMHYNNELK